MPHNPDKGDHRQNWATPREFFKGLDATFRFNLDVCAEPWSACCEDFYVAQVDGLAQPWCGTLPGEQARVWCNPPFGNVRPWLEKAIDSVLEHDSLCVFLLPASTGSAWFHELIYDKADIGFVRGRLNYMPPPDAGDVADSATFDSMIAVYHMDALRGMARVFSVSRDGRIDAPQSRPVQRPLGFGE